MAERGVRMVEMLIGKGDCGSKRDKCHMRTFSSAIDTLPIAYQKGALSLDQISIHIPKTHRYTPSSDRYGTLSPVNPPKHHKKGTPDQTPRKPGSQSKETQ